MRTHESAEMYLETILVLHERKGYVRSIDIANEMNFSKPSVSIAMKRLRQEGYVSVGKDRDLLLTDAGRAIACRVYERHCFFTQLLLCAGVEPEQAEQDACRMEHVLSADSFEAIKRHITEEGFVKLKEMLICFAMAKPT